MKKIDSWFPWNGSKRWLLQELEEVLKQYSGEGKYIEPFVGSGSVSRLMKQIHPNVPQILSDANPWLMACYNCQINSPLTALPTDFHDIDKWRKLKDSDIANLTVQQQAFRFAICLHSTWGHRWETLVDGTFRSTKNAIWCEKEYMRSKLEKFMAVKWLSAKDEAHCQDWKAIASRAQKSDVVYLDPPYPDSLGYGNQYYTFSDQLDLVDWAVEAEEKGINVVISNMATIERLYRRARFKTKLIQGPTSTKTRRDRTEVLAWKFIEQMD